jgi:hypothetical protein
MRGIPPTGRRFSVDYVSWLRLEDRKVAKLWAVRDDVARLQQLGLISIQARPEQPTRPEGRPVPYVLVGAPGRGAL